MLIILDIGSTKLKAVYLDKDYAIVKMWTDKGYNFKHDSGFKLKLDQLSSEQINTVQVVKIFAAGLSEESKKEDIHTILKSQFPSLNDFEIASDLQAAIQSFYSDQDQIVGIIGTGSHFNLVNKEETLTNVVSGGYLLSDEGSGYDIGKTICRKYIHRDFLTKEDHYAFLMSYQLPPEKLVTAIYESKQPKTFLASFAEFLHICTPQTKQQILHDCFLKLAKKIIRSIPNAKQYKCNFVGSIAYHFKEELIEVFKTKGLSIDKIEISPIKDLIAKYKTND